MLVLRVYCYITKLNHNLTCSKYVNSRPYVQVFLHWHGMISGRSTYGPKNVKQYPTLLLKTGLYTINPLALEMDI